MTKQESQAEAQLLCEADQNPWVPGEAHRHVWLNQNSWSRQGESQAWRGKERAKRRMREIRPPQRMGMEGTHTGCKMHGWKIKALLLFNNTFYDTCMQTHARQTRKERNKKERDWTFLFCFLWRGNQRFVSVSVFLFTVLPPHCATVHSKLLLSVRFVICFIQTFSVVLLLLLHPASLNLSLLTLWHFTAFPIYNMHLFGPTY